MGYRQEYVKIFGLDTSTYSKLSVIGTICIYVAMHGLVTSKYILAILDHFWERVWMAKFKGTLGKQ